MLIWLSGIDNTRRPPNENYARELMELFTLGASDALRLSLLRGRRSRAGAGADRLARRLGRRRRLRELPLRRRRATTPARRRSSARPAPSTGATPAASASSTRRTRPSSSTSSGATSSRCRRRRRRARRSSASTSSAATRSARWSRRSSCTRRSTAGRRWSSRRSSTSPACTAPVAQGISGDWAWIADIAGQHLFRPPNVSGWNEHRWLDTSTFRGRWIAANEIAGVDAVDPEAPYNDDRERQAARSEGASRFWGNPVLSKPTAQGPRCATPARSQAVGDRGLAAEHLPSPAPERPADADRHLPRPPAAERAERWPATTATSSPART